MKVPAGWWANTYPIRLAFAFLFADACDRSLDAALAHLERSTHLRPRKPITPKGGHPDYVNFNSGPFG
jgi:hypothetical protein